LTASSGALKTPARAMWVYQFGYLDELP